MEPMIPTPGQAPAEARPAPGAAPATPFTRPDISKSIPAEQQDAVGRIVASGMRVMYAPEMKSRVLEVVKSQEPIPKKLAESVVGLMLMLDQRAKGGLPIEALPYAAVELLGEAAELLSAANQPVSDEDFKTAATMTVWLTARKMGATDEQVMAGLQQGGAPAAQEPAMPQGGV